MEFLSKEILHKDCFSSPARALDNFQPFGQNLSFASLEALRPWSRTPLAFRLVFPAYGSLVLQPKPSNLNLLVILFAPELSLLFPEVGTENSGKYPKLYPHSNSNRPRNHVKPPIYT